MHTVTQLVLSRGILFHFPRFCVFDERVRGVSKFHDQSRRSSVVTRFVRFGDFLAFCRSGGEEATVVGILLAQARRRREFANTTRQVDDFTDQVGIDLFDKFLPVPGPCLRLAMISLVA